MKKLISFVVVLLAAASFSLGLQADTSYQRNRAVQVEKVLFGQVQSVRHITQQDLIEDRNKGWKVFGGALIGGAIGNQFGSGDGQVAATILGTLIGANLSNKKNPRYQRYVLHLVELMINTDEGLSFLVVQDFDSSMVFAAGDAVRMIYLAGDSVRVDKQF